MLHHLHTLSLIAAFTGFCANLAQVALFRFFMGQFYGTEIHLGLFLSIWLLGIAAGGFSGGKTEVKPQKLLTALLAMPLLSVTIIYFGASLLPAPDGGFLPFLPVALFMLAVVTPVSFIIGTLIPCLIRLTHRSIGYYYSLEAIGGFIGGIFFSLLLGGTADSILCLLALPVMPLMALTVSSRRKMIPAMLTLLVAPAVWFFGPEISQHIEQSYWQRLHQTVKLEKTSETPYQKLQLASYYEQKSLFANGMLADSWPVAEAVESKVHSFVSALPEYSDILLIGAPTTEVVAEFHKYQGLKLCIVENDPEVFNYLGYTPAILQSVTAETADPRQYLNSAGQKFDGIMICPVSPVTLVGNRLFTLEAFRAMKGRLKPAGVLSLQVEGSENYLGTIKEKIILSTWKALQQEFSDCSAMPGSTITFFASQAPLPDDAKAFASRFASRGITTTTFYPMSFHNLMMPYRVEELKQWLQKDIAVSLNTDAHPDSFAQQLELWNVYSGTSLNKFLRILQQTPGTRLFAIFAAAGFFLMLLPAFTQSKSAAKSIIAGGVAVSGATGLLSEIILILLYQNRHGAAYQMTAFFFGIYMLGLAGGAMMFGHIQKRGEALHRLKFVKLLQLVFTAGCILFVEQNDLHSAPVIGLMVFMIAFLDGIEFPVSDSILRSIGRQAHDSAGLLLLADNSGALLAGALSGLWLLPAFGMQTCFGLLCAALLINLIGLFIFSRHIHES